MSVANTEPVIVWGGKNLKSTENAVSFTDVMSEDLAKDLQKKEESQGTESETGLSDICGGFQDMLPDQSQDTNSDELLAHMLQLQFDQEYDRDLIKEEAKCNGTSKVGVSLSNYRKIPKGSFLDEDSDLSNDEWEPKLDSFEASEKVCPVIPRAGYAKIGEEIVTKHDTVISSRKNACRAMALGGIDIGDGGKFDMKLPNKVYNNLKVFSKSEEKRAAKLTDKQEKATSTLALDPKSRLIIFRMVDNNILERLNGAVSTGKEAVIFHAEGGTTEDVIVPKECAIKVFKTTLNEFKTRDKYIAEDYRFRNRFSKQNPRKVIHMWAEKEFHNLTRMRQAQMNCPDVVLLKKHILVMSFLGKDGNPAPKIREAALTVEEVNQAYSQTVSMMQTLYHECHLVHADLSEYNILWHEQKCWFIDVSQAVEPTHPHALEFLYRDCCNVSNFFTRLGAKDAVEPAQLFSAITGHHVNGREAEVLSQIRDFERNEEILAFDDPSKKLYPFDYCWKMSKEDKQHDDTKVD